MTRKLYFLLLPLLSSSLSFATADSPVVQGLGGGGRAGVPKEALFTNPASAALLTASSFYLSYTKPSIPDWNAGGRSWSAGSYDAGSPEMKGGLGYSRISRARIDGTVQGYDDRTDIRFVVARPIYERVLVGANARYITKRTSVDEAKFFRADLGAIFPIFSDLRGGLTYENIFERAGEPPGTVGAGLFYPFGFGLGLFADGTRKMEGGMRGDKGYALGAEMGVSGDMQFRAGRFLDGHRRLKGWAMGFSWVGPRLSLDYSFRLTGKSPRERDHIVGVNVTL